MRYCMVLGFVFLLLSPNRVIACMGGGGAFYQALKNLKIKPVKAENFYQKKYQRKKFRYIEGSDILIAMKQNENSLMVRISVPSKYVNHSMHFVFEQGIDIEVKRGKPWQHRSLIRTMRLRLNKTKAGNMEVGFFPDKGLRGPFWFLFDKKTFNLRYTWHKTGFLRVSVVVFGVKQKGMEIAPIIATQSRQVIAQNVCTSSNNLYH